MLDQSNKEMKNLLKMKLTSEEKDRLQSEGFNFKNPTKQTVILVALYKKAASGDMNAIREISSMMGVANDYSGESVQIIDNVNRFIS